MKNSRAGAPRRRPALVKFIQSPLSVRRLQRLTAFACTLALTALLQSVPGLATGDEAAGDAVPQTLQELTDAFLQQNNLTEERFSFGYYNTLTGEEYYAGGDRFFVGGSIYKLPLNMLYVEMLADGRADPDRRISGYTYPEIQRQSIQYSNNELSQALRRSFSPDKADYRMAILKFSGLQPDELPDNYAHENSYSPRFMIGTLQYLYNNADRFSDIIGYMKLAHPGRYLENWDSEYEIAHKYGYFEGQLNDVAIIYTPEPFFLVVFTRGVYEETLGEFCRLMTDYTLASDAQYQALQARVEAAAAESVPSVVSGTEQSVVSGTETGDAPELPLAALCVAGGAAVLPGLAVAVFRHVRRRRPQHWSH